MRFLLDLALAVVIAIVVGISTAWYAVDRGRIFGSVTAGDWTAWPAEGTTDADPYSLAMLARTADLPLGASEGLSFTADRDDQGEPLSGACSYDVTGQPPAARLWTLTAYDQYGHLIPNGLGRPGFHSREIVRRESGDFTIRVSPIAASGNWLPIGAPGRFELELRLYDTPLTTGAQLAALTMPRISKVACQ